MDQRVKGRTDLAESQAERKQRESDDNVRSELMLRADDYHKRYTDCLEALKISGVALDELTSEVLPDIAFGIQTILGERDDAEPIEPE